MENERLVKVKNPYWQTFQSDLQIQIDTLIKHIIKIQKELKPSAPNNFSAHVIHLIIYDYLIVINIILHNYMVC